LFFEIEERRDGISPGPELVSRKNIKTCQPINVLIGIRSHRTLSMTLKIAVVEPIPRASVRMDTKAKRRSLPTSKSLEVIGKPG